MSLLDDNDKLKLAKAVFNHTKTVANEYIEKHAKSTPNVNGVDINEDKFYEIAMLEIEEDNKVKSTWARALTQTDGDKEKLEPTYIKLRVAELVQEEKERIVFYQEYERAQKIRKQEEDEKRKLEDEKRKLEEEEIKSKEDIKKWFEREEIKAREEEKYLLQNKNKDNNLIFLFIIVAFIFVGIYISLNMK